MRMMFVETGLLSSEGSLFLFKRGNRNQEKSAKRVNIVSVKLVKESSMLYKNRGVRSRLLHSLAASVT
jgi:hypothetical protein